MKFKIEKDIPVPMINSKRKKAPKYPLAKMAIGDSFEFDENLVVRIRSAIQDYKESHPRTCFVTRRTHKENGTWKYRCWRVAKNKTPERIELPREAVNKQIGKHLKVCTKPLGEAVADWERERTKTLADWYRENK